jgi:formiminoglutamase
MSCAPQIETSTRQICDAAQGYSAVTNRRFKGGWTTRHYGCPTDGWHAIQMELAQSTYYLSAESAPWHYYHTKAARLRPHLTNILTNLAALAVTLKDKS